MFGRGSAVNEVEFLEDLPAIEVVELWDGEGGACLGVGGIGDS